MNQKLMNRSELKMLEMLKDVGRFILGDCHKFEENVKGKYETRRKIESIGDRIYKISGSGDCNVMAKKIFNLIAEVENKKIKKPCNCSTEHTNQHYQGDFDITRQKGNYKCETCGNVQVWDKDYWMGS